MRFRPFPSALAILAIALLLPSLPARAQGIPQVQRLELQESDPSLRMKVDVAYPSLSLPEALMGMQGNVRDANAKFARWAESTRAAFLARVREQGSNLELPGDNDLRADYAVLANDGRLVAVKFEVSGGILGNAHPTTEVATMNLELGGENLTIDNLFASQSDALARIAPLVTKRLRTRATVDGYSLFDQGLAPTADNYRNVLVTSEGLRFYFNPAVVAPGYVGVVHVNVPWNEIRALLAPSTAWIAP